MINPAILSFITKLLTACYIIYFHMDGKLFDAFLFHFIYYLFSPKCTTWTFLLSMTMPKHNAVLRDDSWLRMMTGFP